MTKKKKLKEEVEPDSIKKTPEKDEVLPDDEPRIPPLENLNFLDRDQPWVSPEIPEVEER